MGMQVVAAPARDMVVLYSQQHEHAGIHGCLRGSKVVAEHVIAPSQCLGGDVNVFECSHTRSILHTCPVLLLAGGLRELHHPACSLLTVSSRTVTCTSLWWKAGSLRRRSNSEDALWRSPTLRASVPA